MEVESGGHAWKNVMGKAVHTAENIIGVPGKNVENLVYRVGGVIADHFDPANREQRLLKELWEQGNDNERQTLASLFARMAKHDVEAKGPAKGDK